MKKYFLISVGLISVAIAVYFIFFSEPTFKAKDGYLNNIDKQGLAIQGYDPVAYFTDNKPLKGVSKYPAEYNGATYWFNSEQHQNLFKSNPKQYAPQYGSFCGYAVSIGKLRPVDPTIYQIENGRLILQHTQEAYDLFNKNLKASIE